MDPGIIERKPCQSGIGVGGAVKKKEAPEQNVNCDQNGVRESAAFSCRPGIPGKSVATLDVAGVAIIRHVVEDYNSESRDSQAVSIS
jgi:hypothetical protein